MTCLNFEQNFFVYLWCNCIISNKNAKFSFKFSNLVSEKKAWNYLFQLKVNILFAKQNSLYVYYCKNFEINIQNLRNIKVFYLLTIFAKFNMLLRYTICFWSVSLNLKSVTIIKVKVIIHFFESFLFHNIFLIIKCFLFNLNYFIST